MNSALHRLSALALATALIAWAGPAKAQQGPISEGLNEAGRAVKRGFQTAGQAVSSGFQKTKNSVHNMEVVSRVYSRLHWDKALTGATMEIEVQAGGVAILTGVVPSEEAKTKALTLTAETVGVNQVVNQLTIAAVTRPAPVVSGNPPTSSSTIIVTPPSAVVVPPPATTPKPKDTDIPL
jgi:hyperosmotically inducible periplasmic protein